MRFFPRRRGTRILAVVLAFPFICLVLLYLVLLGMQAYSARQASRILDRVEALRVGDPEAKFHDAVKGCELEKMEEWQMCSVHSGAFTVQSVWIWKFGDDFGLFLLRQMRSIGLNFWQLRVEASVSSKKVDSVRADLIHVGRYERLETSWTLSRNPVPYKLMRERPFPPEELRTYMHPVHIMSMPSGEAFVINTSPESTDAELRARRINRHCLINFGGCNGFCELLPDAVTVLNERKRGWGICKSGIPRPLCDSQLQYDKCYE